MRTDRGCLDKSNLEAEAGDGARRTAAPAREPRQTAATRAHVYNCQHSADFSRRTRGSSRALWYPGRGLAFVGFPWLFGRRKSQQKPRSAAGKGRQKPSEANKSQEKPIRFRNTHRAAGTAARGSLRAPESRPMRK